MNYSHLSEVWKRAVEELLNPPQGIMLPWWPKFNQYLNGLRPHEVTLFCAPTGSGKTQWLANISAQLLLQNISHFAAPVETGDSDFLIRTVEAIEQRDLNTGSAIAPELLNNINIRISDVIQNGKLFISSYDNRVDIHDMIMQLKFVHQEHGCQVAILDNLNFFLKVTSSQMERAEMDQAIHEFVVLAKKEIPMHIILVVHPRKTENGRVVSEFDIKGSSTAVQEAQNVILFNRPSEEQKTKYDRLETDRELVFKKIRKRGIHVNKTVWFEFNNGKYTEFKKKNENVGSFGSDQ